MRMNQGKTFLAIVLISTFFFIVLTMSSTVIAEIIYVDAGGSADFTSIQEAIDNANESDTIHIYSGIYNENLLISKSIQLRGDDSESTLIRGMQSASVHTIKITADNVSVRDVTISNELRQSQDFPCIFVDEAAGFKLDSCIITKGERGILLQYAINAEIKNCVIENNNQKGVKLYFADECLIHDNQIKNNGDGMRLHGSDDNSIYNNIISGNGFGILMSASVDNVFYENEFSANSAENAEDTTATGSNSWSYNEKGNYWDDYQDYDSNDDGIGDDPYSISGGDNKDYYPLGIFLTTSHKPNAYIDSINPSSTTEDESVNFQGHGTDEDGYIINWEWSSSIDGLIHSSSADFSISSLSVGTHVIRFRVQDDDEQWSSYDEESLIIQSVSEDNQIPSATIVTVNPTESEQGEEIYFHGYGSDPDGMITSYQWSSRKDGVLSSDPTFSISTLSVGTHTISFKVKDNDGDWSSEKTTQVKITAIQSENLQPVAEVGGPYTGTVNTSVLFDASDSYDSDGGIEEYSWNFGDGGSGSGKMISHTYKSSGNYTVVLTITDTQGSMSEDTALVTIEGEENNNNNSSNSNQKNSNESDSDDNTEQHIPGFEFFLILIGIVFILFSRVRRK